MDLCLGTMPAMQRITDSGDADDVREVGTVVTTPYVKKNDGMIQTKIFHIPAEEGRTAEMLPLTKKSNTAAAIPCRR